MKAYGNLINRVMECSRQVEPEVGMGATITAYTDRYAGTVVDVMTFNMTPRLVVVREDKATRTDSNGMSDSQDYAYEPNRAGRQWIFKQDRKGLWREAQATGKGGRWCFVSGGGYGLVLGVRDKYHDLSF